MSKDFYFTLDAVKILDDCDLGTGEVRLVSLCSTELVPQSDENLIRIETQLFENVETGDYLPLGPGKLLYHSKEIPNFLNWAFLAFEDDSGTRKTGEKIKEVVNSTAFKDTQASITDLLKGTFDYTLAGNLIKSAMDLFGSVLMLNENDQIGASDFTFIHKKHDLEDLQCTGLVLKKCMINYHLTYL